MSIKTRPTAKPVGHHFNGPGKLSRQTKRALARANAKLVIAKAKAKRAQNLQRNKVMIDDWRFVMNRAGGWRKIWNKRVA